MANLTVVLYGNRLFDKTTYSTNQDPQSFSATLSDSVSLSDTEKQAAIKVLAEAITMAETWKTSGNKVLSDSTTMTETLAKALVTRILDGVTMTDSEKQAAIKAIADALAVADTIIMRATKPLSESMTMTEQRLIRAVTVLVDSLLITDNKVGIQQIKGLSDFIRVKDWIEFRWKKAEVWSTVSTFNVRPSNLHKYGPGVYYGVDYYSSNPTVNWLLQTADQATWKTIPAQVSSLPLYAQTQYGKNTFSNTPVVGWTKPVDAGKENWTNNDGESHN